MPSRHGLKATASASAPPQRERAKNERRERIFAAAEALIRETGSTDFSMALLAERAQVSIPTPYNLLGSKSEILYALLERSVDSIFLRQAASRQGADGVAGVVNAGRLGTETFIAERRLYQPLYRYLLGVPDQLSRPRFIEKARSYWDAPLQKLLEAKVLPSQSSVQQLARLVFAQFVGALELWIQNDFDDEQFAAQIEVGILSVLLGYVADDQKKKLLRQLNVLERRLPGHF